MSTMTRPLAVPQPSWRPSQHLWRISFGHGLKKTWPLRRPWTVTGIQKETTGKAVIYVIWVWSNLWVLYGLLYGCYMGMLNKCLANISIISIGMYRIVVGIQMLSVWFGDDGAIICCCRYRLLVFHLFNPLFPIWRFPKSWEYRNSWMV